MFNCENVYFDICVYRDFGTSVRKSNDFFGDIDHASRYCLGSQEVTQARHNRGPIGAKTGETVGVMRKDMLLEVYTEKDREGCVKRERKRERERERERERDKERESKKERKRER